MSSTKAEFYKTVTGTLNSCLEASINELISEKTVQNLNGYSGVLSEEKIKTTMMIASGAKFSVFTVMKMADWEGFFVKDIYPIARSIVESLVNSTYIMLEDETVARKAYKYVGYAEYKFSNREIGSGEYKLKISSLLEADEEKIKQYFSEFKKQKSWTDLDLPSRIRVIGDLGNHSAALDFLGAYSLIYSVSSEIIHGSPYGMNYFIKDSKNEEGQSFEAFLGNTEKKVELVLLSIILALTGYLKVNSTITKKDQVLEVIEKLSNGVLENSIEYFSKN